MFSQPKTLRARLIYSYSKSTNQTTCLPTNISSSQFMASMNKWLAYANVPYANKENNGIFYAEDYANYYSHGEESINIKGVTNQYYWDLRMPENCFKALEEVEPSKALHAFFVGPTIAECGSVLQACVYKAIEEMVGTKAFNQKFSSPLIPFLITPSVFRKIYSHVEKPYYPLQDRIYNGNPLYFLYDDLAKINESEIHLGDILYIEGVEKYVMKHLVGSGCGWNVICVGKNEIGENLYLGFGPESFQGPRTYQQIRSILVHYYNVDPLIDSKNVVEACLKSDDSFNKERGEIAGLLANDKVDEHFPIGGIKHVLRFNLDKLKTFISQKQCAWYDTEFVETTPDIKQKMSFINQITPFSVETRDKTFEHYEASTPSQKQMLSLAKKFAFAVCHHQSAIGLVMTGMPGIGKTHLSVAIANDVSRHGLKVAYVDETSIGNLYQKLSEKSRGKNIDSEINEIFDQWLKGADLIVLDDINAKYGIGPQFLKKAIKYVTEYNKAILVSGNQPVDFIQESVYDYIGHDNVDKNNFYVMKDIDGQSYRKKWWINGPFVSSSNHLHTNQDAMTVLAQLQNEQAAGIVIEEKNPNLSELASTYLTSSPYLNEKIRVILGPYKNNYVYDSHVHDFAEHDVFLINVNDLWEAEQLLNLIGHVHDLGKKIIVITESETELFNYINNALSLSILENDSIRLRDRAKNILLKKSDWPLLSLAPTIIKARQIIDPDRITIGPEKYSQKQNEIHYKKTTAAASPHRLWKGVPSFNNKKKAEGLKKDTYCGFRSGFLMR